MSQPEAWRDIEDMRLWCGKGCGGGHVLFLWGEKLLLGVNYGTINNTRCRTIWNSCKRDC